MRLLVPSNIRIVSTQFQIKLKFRTKYMGIPKGLLSILFELKTTEILQGSVCQLGRQTCDVSEAQVGGYCKTIWFLLAFIQLHAIKKTM